jgi:hypothetical protein
VFGVSAQKKRGKRTSGWELSLNMVRENVKTVKLYYRQHPETMLKVTDTEIMIEQTKQQIT